MALRWIDGFDHYSAAHSSRIYEDGGIISMSTTFPRTGTQCANPHYHDYGVSKYLGVSANVLILGFAYYNDNGAFPGWHNILRFFDGTTEQLALEGGPEGRMRIRSGSNVLATTQPLAYSLKQWQYVELKVTFGAPGSYELRINTKTTLSGSGTTRQSTNNSANWVRLNGPNGDFVDDLYICDNSGTLNNDFLGDIKVVTVYPNAEGSVLEWTPSSGSTHYTLVDEAPANDDTDYVYTSTVGATETLNFQDITLTGSILGVGQFACIRKDDAGTREACLICRVGNTNYEGPQQTVNNTYSYLKQVRETNPATGAPWTLSEFNSAQFGVRMKA
ncbi:MAG: hypothetical protein RMK79_10420 [Anaerolineae bacterium]|nr:hypothetical protein [Anaerolineae bacterium]